MLLHKALISNNDSDRGFGLGWFFFFRLHDDRVRFNLNLEVQLMLKQGQVEVDPTNFIQDYKDSALIHRTVVEELNSNIKVGHRPVMCVKTGVWIEAYLGQGVMIKCKKVEQLCVQLN